MQFEPPDVLHLFTSGVVEPHHFENFFKLGTQLISDRPIYVLRDASGGGELGAKTRARIIELAQPHLLGGIVNYGASFHMRVVVTMLLKAIRAFKHSIPDVAFVETESEGRAWIDARRRQKHGGPST